MALLARAIAGKNPSRFSTTRVLVNSTTAPPSRIVHTRFLSTDCFGRGLAKEVYGLPTACVCVRVCEMDDLQQKACKSAEVYCCRRLYSHWRAQQEQGGQHSCPCFAQAHILKVRGLKGCRRSMYEEVMNAHSRGCTGVLWQLENFNASIPGIPYSCAAPPKSPGRIVCTTAPPYSQSIQPARSRFPLFGLQSNWEHGLDPDKTRKLKHRLTLFIKPPSLFLILKQSKTVPSIKV
eukprot:1161271-Pelagomonas_calceolata.AAC.1